MNKTVKLEEGIKANKTYTYMLPLLCRELNVPNLLNIEGIFVKSEEYKEYNNHLFCLFRWSPNRVHTKFEDDLLKHPLCEFHKDVSSKHYLMCFKISENLQHNYDYFLKSQYSKITTEGKKHILEFFGLGKDHAVAMVLYKDSRLKKKYEETLGVKLDNDAELSSILDIDGKECYKNSYIIESQSPLPKL